MPSLSPPDDSASTRQSLRHALRRELRARRRALSASQQKIAARHLAQHLSRLPALRKSRRIALYWPMDGEIDPRGLQGMDDFSGHEFYLPVLQRFPAGTLRFARSRKHGPRLQKNRFGIPEPRGRRALPAAAMDVILLPLTGFDAKGNRLGMGGGFYDRTLAVQHWRGHQRPLLIGVAHACQEMEQLPLQSWDVPLHWVVSDRRALKARR